METRRAQLASTLRVAAFQCAPLADDIPETTRRLLREVQWCETQGVDLVVFPECFLQGYTTDPRLIASRAIAADSPQLQACAAAFAGLAPDLIVGFIERRATGFYNAAAVVRGARVAGIYAKNHPNEQAFLPGDASPVFRKRDLTYGINICADANFPASARRLANNGAQLICYPLNNLLEPATADRWRVRSVRNLQARAVETGCWVVSSDVVGRHQGKLSHGCTCIVNPDGAIVSMVAHGLEGVLVHDIKF